MANQTNLSVLDAKKNSNWKSFRFRESINGYMFLVPFLVMVLVFQIYVFASGFYLALTDAQGINPGKFIGLENYIELLKHSRFWRSVRVTLLFTGGCLLTQIPVAFLLASILNNLKLKILQSALRAAFFVPVLVNSIVVSWLFRQIFNPDQGIANWFFHLLGYHGARIEWLQDPNLTIPLLIIVSFWQWMGFHLVYFVSQLQTIDPSYYEAAKIDGASPFQILIHITMPLMRPALTYAMVTSAIGSLMMFDYSFMVFQNATYGPGGAGQTLLGYIFDYGFSQQLRLGYATAAGWLTFILIMVVSLIQLRVLGLGKTNEE